MEEPGLARFSSLFVNHVCRLGHAGVIVDTWYPSFLSSFPKQWSAMLKEIEDRHVEVLLVGWIKKFRIEATGKVNGHLTLETSLAFYLDLLNHLIPCWLLKRRHVQTLLGESVFLKHSLPFLTLHLLVKLTEQHRGKSIQWLIHRHVSNRPLLELVGNMGRSRLSILFS
jgi:hypothetical protein